MLPSGGMSGFELYRTADVGADRQRLVELIAGFADRRDTMTERELVEYTQEIATLTATVREQRDQVHATLRGHGVAPAPAARAVNRNILALARRLGETERIGFICECADLACVTPITLGAAGFEAVLAEPGAALLADAHRPT